jgi:hypothetical protein
MSLVLTHLDQLPFSARFPRKQRHQCNPKLRLPGIRHTRDLSGCLEKITSKATCQENGGWFNPTTSHPGEGISAINQPVEPVTFQFIIHVNFKDIPHCGPEHFERLDTAGCRRTLHLTRSVALLIGDAHTSMGWTPCDTSCKASRQSRQLGLWIW